MAKLALGILAFLAVFVTLVLVAGSIPPQPTPEAGQPTTVGRGHVVEQAARRD